jgi:hypothetical protein
VDGPLLPSTNKLADIPIEAVVSPEFMGWLCWKLLHQLQQHCNSSCHGKAGFVKDALVGTNPPADLFQHTVLFEEEDEITFSSVEDSDTNSQSRKSFYERIIPLAKEIANVIVEKPYDKHIGVLYPFILGLCL